MSLVHSPKSPNSYQGQRRQRRGQSGTYGHLEYIFEISESPFTYLSILCPGVKEAVVDAVDDLYLADRPPAEAARNLLGLAMNATLGASL